MIRPGAVAVVDLVHAQATAIGRNRAVAVAVEVGVIAGRRLLSVHFRRHGVNYGFVTFSHKQDAYDAVARGNDNKDEPQYDLSFGGRRLFCQTTYADLDNMHDDVLYDEFGAWPADNLCAGGADAPAKDDNSFDNLLRKAQAKLRNRKL